jgi:tetratricopeptide (TPR) repeat protein
MPLVAGAAAAAQPDPWHLAGWQSRAVVEIPNPLPQPGIDVAAVKILCLGRAKPDGADYRVLDAAGQPLPFQLVYHDAAHYSLISFRVLDPRARHFIYFDNPGAMPPPERVAADPRPGAGPQKGAWIPHYGLVFATIQRPEGKNPATVEELSAMIAASRASYGARYQRRIADGYNPFGPSDYYMSLYRGWLWIPAKGKYWFCTDSNEASFSFVDGRDLVHWPGRHTVERGLHGEKNAAVELDAGPHYIEYYQEEVTLEQMAFLGWRRGPAGSFSAIPESAYPPPHEATVTRYESPDGILAAFEPVILDSIWPENRPSAQYTRCRFTAVPTGTLPETALCRWDFGDGQTAAGPSVEHAYLRLGERAVTLAVSELPRGGHTRWPLLVYEIQQVTDQMPAGRIGDYAALARTYDPSGLDTGSLEELVFVLSDGGFPAEAMAAGREFLDRCPAAAPETRAGVLRRMADSARRLGPPGFAEAATNYQDAIRIDPRPSAKLECLAALIAVVGVEQRQPEKTGDLLRQAEDIAREAAKTPETLAGWRRVLIAAGDAALWNHQRGPAAELYRRAEVVSSPVIPPSVRAARLGAYPDTVRDYLKASDFRAALETLDTWEEVFPEERAVGHSLFWRGKTFWLQGKPQEASRFLSLSAELASGGDFETECRWLLGQTLDKLGRPEEAKRVYEALAACGMQDRFVEQARGKIGKEPGKR